MSSPPRDAATGRRVALVLAVFATLVAAATRADAHLALARRSLTSMSGAAAGIVLARADGPTKEIPGPSGIALGATVFADVEALAGLASARRIVLVGAAPIVRYGAGARALLFLSPGLDALAQKPGEKAIDRDPLALPADLPVFSSAQIAGTRLIVAPGADLDPSSRRALAELWRATHGGDADDRRRGSVTALVGLLGSTTPALRWLAFLDLEAFAHHPAAFGAAQLERLEKYGDAPGDDTRIASSVRALARRIRAGGDAPRSSTAP